MISNYKQFKVHPDYSKLMNVDIHASKLLNLSMYHSCLFIFWTILNSDYMVFHILKDTYIFHIVVLSYQKVFLLLSTRISV
jgi:hypothetical protein